MEMYHGNDETFSVKWYRGSTQLRLLPTTEYGVLIVSAETFCFRYSHIRHVRELIEARLVLGVQPPEGEGPWIPAKQGDSIDYYGERHVVAQSDLDRGYIAVAHYGGRHGHWCMPVFLRPRKAYVPGNVEAPSWSEW